MTLKFVDQSQQVKGQTDLLARVAAGAFAAAVVAYGAVALTDPIKQAQRMKLVNALVLSPDYGSKTFAWLIVSQSAVNTAADLTDTFIENTITSNFDAVAQQLFLTVP